MCYDVPSGGCLSWKLVVVGWNWIRVSTVGEVRVWKGNLFDEPDECKMALMFKFWSVFD